MKYNWPETKFVKENDVMEQITHFMSAVDEMNAEGPIELTGDKEEDLKRLFPLLREAMDAHHSLETLWRIVDREYGAEMEDLLHCLEADTYVKNAARGYYPGVDTADYKGLGGGSNQ